MIKLAIIEDESKTRSFLHAIVKNQNNDITVVGEAESVETGLALINKMKPDAILLDVEMGDGTGFDLLSQLGQTKPHVIFVTAYDHYAVQALRADAVDYIEKPVDPEELDVALKKVSQLVLDQIEPEYGPILDSIKSGIQEKIAVPTRSGLVYLNVHEILCIKADGAYSEIFVEHSTKPIVISRTLKDVQPTLERMGFIRLHRSYLVNASKIKELSRADGGYIVLTNKLKVPFSKQYKEDAINAIKQMTTFL